ncbi:MAG: PhnD/SsuA/transferrin family substrate-binding protein [Sedimentisphaerales bacterium]|nr:PhnD/SsuA/transferrin family substrate-binding protein [Sedimentisphaerales bacterium]
MKRHVIFLLLIGLGTSLCIAEEQQHKTVQLTFGVYQSDKATTMYRMFLPVIEKVQERAEELLEQPVDIYFKIFKTYQEAQDALVNGEVDFVRFGPASYVLSKKKNPDIQLLAIELVKGEMRFNGMIITRADSGIESLWELEGRSFAFGDKDSTIGRYLAQAELIRAGLYLKDLSHFEYLGRHDKVATAVLMKDFDAGSLKESTYKKYNKDGELRILKTFENVSKPWIARKDLEPRVFQALRQSLLELKDPDSLKDLKISGFGPVTDKDYAFVRGGMRAAAYFDPQPSIAQSEQ